MSEMDFYPGFEWAVPKAFAAAVHACRFEQGDVLYSEPSAYSGSRRAKKPARYHIQVFDPPRTTRAMASDGEGQRFFSNWESIVRFECKDYRSGARVERSVSQGQLFSCLWKGDPELVLADPAPTCDRPLLLRDLQSRVEDAAGQIREKRVEKRSSSRAKKRQMFVLAVDQSGDASRVKARSIVRALEARFDVEAVSHDPAELELPEAERFHPTLELLAVVIDCEDSGKVEATLRDVLYAGGKAGAGEAGRFQLARHGSLIEI